jgi:hypothetical protein
MSVFGEVIRARLERKQKKIEVAEWGTEGEPLELWFFPFSINDAKKLNAYLKEKSSNAREDEYTYFIIFNAKTKDGEQAFDFSDAEWISNQPLNLIIDIYLQANDRAGFSETLKK